MSLLALVGIGLLVYYFVRKDKEPAAVRSWMPWAGLALLALPLLGMGRGFGRMGGGHMGGSRGMIGGGRGMMGPGQWGDGPGMMGHGHMGGWGGAVGTPYWWVYPVVHGVLLLVGVAVVVWAVRKYLKSRPDPEMAALRQRLINGEITPEEFETIKAALQA